MKKILSAVLVGAIFILTMAVAFAANYVGNANSGIFHYSDCPSAMRMKESNKVAISSRDEAVQRGYRPCKKCSP